jgi:hypothetical protein
VSNSFANKLSLNLLQDRLACASQLSLKGVIATNLVVNFGQNREKNRHGAMLMPWIRIHRPSQVSFTCSTVISALFGFVGKHWKIDTLSPLIGNCTLSCSPYLQLLWHVSKLDGFR